MLAVSRNCEQANSRDGNRGLPNVHDFHKVQQIAIACSERKSQHPTLCVKNFGHAQCIARPWTCWIPLDSGHGASSFTWSAWAAGRPFYFKLNLLIFSSGAQVHLRQSEQRYFYHFVCSFAFRHQRNII